MALMCGQCESPFERPHSRGPVPKWCSSACRQAAHRARHQRPLKAAYVSVSKASVARTMQPRDDVLIDVSEDGALVGVAIFFPVEVT